MSETRDFNLNSLGVPVVVSTNAPTVPTLKEIKKSYEVYVGEPTSKNVYSVLSQSVIADDWQIINNDLSKNTIEGTNLLKIECHYQELYQNYVNLDAAFTLQSVQVLEKEEEANKNIKLKEMEIADWKELLAAQDIKNKEMLAEQARKTQEVLEKMNKMLLENRVYIDEMKSTIAKKNEEIVELNEVIANKDVLINTLAIENKHLREQLQELSTDYEHEILGEDALGKPWKPLNGFKHLFAPITPKSFFTKEKEEQKLKLAVDNPSKLETMLVKDKYLQKINGRGMPDTPVSLIAGYRDKTPLMLAAEWGVLESIKILLENGANINYLDRNNFTALDYAQHYRHKEIANFLIMKGALNGYDALDILEPSIIRPIA